MPIWLRRSTWFVSATRSIWYDFGQLSVVRCPLQLTTNDGPLTPMQYGVIMGVRAGGGGGAFVAHLARGKAETAHQCRPRQEPPSAQLRAPARVAPSGA